jgi:hypothetical protein
MANIGPVLMRCPNVTDLEVSAHPKFFERLLHVIQSKQRKQRVQHDNHTRELPTPALGKVRRIRFDVDPSDLSYEERRSYQPIPLFDVTELELRALMTYDLRVIDLTPCLRHLVLSCFEEDQLDDFWVSDKSPRNGSVPDVSQSTQQQLSEMDLPTLETIELDQKRPCTLHELSSPEWIGAVEVSYAFDKEKRYATEWLAATRDRMPQLRDVKMKFSITKWSSTIGDFSTGGHRTSLDKLFLRTLRLEASLQGSGASTTIQSSACWEHTTTGNLPFDMRHAHARYRFAEENGIDVSLVHFLLGGPPEDLEWPAGHWDRIVEGARECLNGLRGEGSAEDDQSPSQSPASSSQGSSSSSTPAQSDDDD